MLKIVTGNKAHKAADRGLNLYETPTVATDTLLDIEKLPKRIWEPACGPGAIAHVLRERGHVVTASDIVDYGCKDAYADIDFLECNALQGRSQAIVTNPPYNRKLPLLFAQHALKLKAEKVCLLLRLACLEGVERKQKLFDVPGLARVWVFSRRLPMMHRASWTGPRSSGAFAFAWFVWVKDHEAPTQLRWVDWKDHARPTTYEPTYYPEGSPNQAHQLGFDL